MGIMNWVGNWGTSDSSCFVGFLDRVYKILGFKQFLSLLLGCVVSAQDLAAQQLAL